MKTQEASWRKIRPPPEEPFVVTYTSPSFPPLTVDVFSFFNAVVFVVAVILMYSRRSNQFESFVRCCEFSHRCQRQWLRSRTRFLHSDHYVRKIREVSFSLSTSLAFHSNGGISESLHLSTAFNGFLICKLFTHSFNNVFLS